MASFVVVGTDTDVGKTFISAGLLLSYIDEGIKSIVQKWVSTGDPFGFSEDVKFCLKLANIDLEAIPLKVRQLINPYSFIYPASPHFAAERCEQDIDVAVIKTAYKRLISIFDVVIVEGIGGVAVPLKKDFLLIDLIVELGLPVVVVIKNILGAINHSLLTVEALRVRGISILGLVFNDLDNCDMKIRVNNVDTICGITNLPVLARIPYISCVSDCKEIFDKLRRQIEKRL